MLIDTIKRAVFALIFVASGALGASAQDISVEAGEEWYYENKEELMALHQMLLAQPKIRRVDPGFRLELVSKYDEFDAVTAEKYREIEKFVVELGIEKVDLTREGLNANGKLISVDYVLSSRGYVFTESAGVSVHYIPDEVLLRQLTKRANRTLVSLDMRDWYVEFVEKK